MGETVSRRASTVVAVVCAFVAVEVIVASVTVTMKYEEQSAVPFLVAKAEALTARRQLLALQAAEAAAAA